MNATKPVRDARLVAVLPEEYIILRLVIRKIKPLPCILRRLVPENQASGHGVSNQARMILFGENVQGRGYARLKHHGPCASVHHVAGFDNLRDVARMPAFACHMLYCFQIVTGSWCVMTSQVTNTPRAGLRNCLFFRLLFCLLRPGRAPYA